MKNIILVLSLIFVLFLSCKKDNNEEQTKVEINGNWNVDSLYDYDPAGMVIMGNTVGMHFKFTDDTIYEEKFYFDEYGNIDTTHYFKFYIESKNDSIIISNWDIPPHNHRFEFIIYSLNENNLQLLWNDISNDEKINLNYLYCTRMQQF